MLCGEQALKTLENSRFAFNDDEDHYPSLQEVWEDNHLRGFWSSKNNPYQAPISQRIMSE